MPGDFDFLGATVHGPALREGDTIRCAEAGPFGNSFVLWVVFNGAASVGWETRREGE